MYTASGRWVHFKIINIGSNLRMLNLFYMMSFGSFTFVSVLCKKHGAKQIWRVKKGSLLVIFLANFTCETCGRIHYDLSWRLLYRSSVIQPDRNSGCNPRKKFAKLSSWWQIPTLNFSCSQVSSNLLTETSSRPVLLVSQFSLHAAMSEEIKIIE